MPGASPEDVKTFIHEDLCTLCSRQRDPRRPFRGQLDKDAVVHTHCGEPLGQRKEETLPFATTRTDLENIRYAK